MFSFLNNNISKKDKKKEEEEKKKSSQSNPIITGAQIAQNVLKQYQDSIRPSSSTNKNTQAQAAKTSAPAQSAGAQAQKPRASLLNPKGFMGLDDAVRAAYVYNSIVYGSGKPSDSRMMEAINNSRDRTIRNMRTPEGVVLTPAQAYRNLDNAAKSRWLSSGENNAVPSLLSREYATKEINANWNKDWLTLADERKEAEKQKKQADDYMAQFDTPIQEARSGITNQLQLQNNTVAPFDERPDDYNDYADNYDRILYDWGVGEKGAYEKIGRIGSREEILARNERIKELWGDIENESNRQYNEARRNMQEHKAEYDIAKSQSEYYGSQLEAIGNRERQRDEYYGLIDQYDDDLTRTDFVPEYDRGHDNAYGSVGELDRGVVTNDVDRIYSFVGGGKEWQSWNSTGKNQISPEYSYAMMMTDGSNGSFNEKGIFMNLYNQAKKEGREPVEAKAFLEGLQPALRARYSGYESVRLQEAARQMPILTSAASLAMGLTNTYLDIPRRIAHLLGDKSTEDPNSWWYATTRQSKQIQDTISEELGGVAGKAYLSLMNSASNLARGLTTAGAGGKVVQSIMGLGGFFLSVDQEATGRYLQDGYSYDQAQKMGAVDGMFEVAEEFLPFETMLGTEGAKFITSWVLNGLSEFGQEFTGGVLFDEIKATLTGKNDREDRINEIIVNGSYTDRNGNQVVLSDDPATAMQQARLQAGKEQMHNALEGGIGGFLGGGLGGFYGTANRAINDVYTGATINQETNVSDGKKAIESLIEVGKNTKDESVQKLAEKVEGQYKGKGKAGDYLTGRLFRAVADATGAEGQETVKGAAWRFIRDDLTDKGVNREAAGEYADIVAKGLLGEKLTNEDKRTLARDQLAIDTWKRFNTKTADAEKIIEEVNAATREQRSVMDTLGEIAGTKPTAGGAMGAELEQSLQKTGGDMERALDDMFSRRSDLLSERYVGAVKEFMADKTSPKNKSFLKDAMQIRAAAMTLGAMPKTSMDEATARKLYDEARAEFDEIDQKRVLKQKTVEPGKGTASFGDAEYGTESWTQKMAGYSKRIRNQAGALAEVAKRAGLSLTFIDDARVDAKTGRDNAKINGFENQDGSIVINLAATEKFGKHMLTTMAHEMTHWLEQNSREGYDSLRQFVLGSLRSKGVNVEQLAVNTIDNQNAVLKGGDGLDFNGAMAEIVAKSCEELLSSRSFQQELAQTDPGTFDKVKTFVKDFVARINAALKDMANYYGSLSWEARQLRDYTEEIGNLWIGARREALGRNAEEGAEAGEGTRFSTAQETAAEERDAKRLKLETPEMLRYSMVGAAAGGNYAERIREAEALSRQGVDAEEIYQQTGAREGFNGKWWVTLDNQNIRMRDGIMEKHRSGKKFRLTEVMDAPELMKAYPALEDIKVQFKRMRAAYGAYQRDTNTIEVDLDTARTNPEMTAITLRHEIQHAIQRIEGVEGGASLYSWKEILDRIGSTDHPLNMYQRSVGEIEARAASKLEGPGMPTREQYANAVSMREYANMRFSLADEERQDRKYLDAVERGDIASATNMLMDKLKKTEGVIPFIAQHGFGGKHAEIAKMIKEGTPESVAAAAYDMAAQVPANAVLIPMPNHSGTVTADTDTMILAQAISRISGRPVVNAMAGNARESRYKAKAEGRKGATAEELGFRKVAELPEGTMPVFVDNVVGSGVTAQAARNAFGGGITLAYAKSTRSKGIEGLKNAIITRDSNGNVIPLSQRFDTSIRDVRFSTQDQEYMDAVRSGDMDTARMMVFDKAKEAGVFTNRHGRPLRLYHGTRNFGFTVFDTSRTKFDTGAIFTTSNRSVANGYSEFGQDRGASSRYIEDDGTDRTIIRNAKNVLNQDWRKLNQEDVQRLHDKLMTEFKEQAAREENIMNSSEYYPPAEIENEFWNVVSAFDSIVNTDEYYFNTEDAEYGRRYAENNPVINYYDQWKAVREYYSQNEEEYNRLRKEGDGYYNLLLNSFDHSDALVDLEYSYKKLIDGENKFINEKTDSVASREELQEDIENWKGRGNYTLFGLPGDKVLEIDAEKAHWTAIKAPEIGDKYYTTDYIVKWAKDKGYSSVIIRNVMDPGVVNEYGDDYVFFDSNQLKSADPVTYDDAGNVIPLSERFNTEQKDIRYSTQDQEYMDAAQRGDMEKAGSIAEAAAKKNGYTIRAYHGTGRGDRVGNIFLPERATSGPMAFFTSSRQIAENYARDKRDTSIAYDEGYGDYYTQFRGKSKTGKDVAIGELWKEMPFTRRQQITEAAKHITQDDDGNIVYDKNAKYGLGGFTDYRLHEHRGNAINALIGEWLEDGTLYNDEGSFLDVLKLAGIENVTWNDPDARHEKVYDTWLKIQNPFNTSKNYNEEFLEGLESWWKKQNKEKYARETNDTDFWDKNNWSFERWVERARDDLKEGNSNIWTSIPDFVTDYLKSLGHDGIQDTGGKRGGMEHTVWIPFSSEQIKSADPVTYDDNGNVIPLSERFNSDQRDIRYSVQDETDMNVNHFMMGMQEGSLQTEQERTMLRQYKELHGALEVSRFALADYRKKLARIDAMTNPSAYDRAEALKLRNLISNYVAKVDRLQEKLAQVTSSEGYAGMMYRQSRIMDDLVNGRSADEVTRTVSALNDRLRKVDAEIAKRQMQIDYLKSNLAGKKLETLVDSKSLDQMARIIRKEYGSTYSKEDLMHDMTAIRLKMAQGQKVDADVEELTWKILQQTKNGGGEDLQALRGITITLGAKQVKELLGSNSSMKELRSIFAGTGVNIRTAKSGEQGLDTDWQQLCDMLPNLNRDAQELDQVDELIRFVQSQKDAMNPNKRYKDQIQGIAEEIQAMIATVSMNAPEDPAAMQILQRMSGIVDEMAGGLEAGRQEMAAARKEIAGLVDEGRLAIRGAEDLQKTIETAIQYNNALSKQSEAARWKHDKAALVAQLKDENTKALLKEQAKWKERIERDRQARESMATNMHLRHQINTNVTRIRKLLLNETDLKNIPEHMKSLAREMLGMILENDVTGGRKITGIQRKDIIDTVKALEEMKKTDGEFTLDDLRMIEDEEAQAVVEDSLADIEDGITLYNGKPENSLLDNLDDYRKALESIAEGVANIVNVINAERYITQGDRQILVADAAQDVYKGMENSRFRGELRGRGSKAINAARSSVGYGNLTPVYFIKNLRNEGMTEQFNELQRGENRSGLEYKKAQDFVGAIAEKTHYKDWAGKKITVRIGSRQVEMTIDNAMEILAIWNREQLETAEAPDKSNHMTRGGIYIRQEEDNKGGLHREKDQQRPMRLNESDIGGIREALTDEQKEYMDKVVGFLSNEMSKLGNEASMRMYGIKKYKEAYYFPMKIWDGVKSARSDKGIAGTDENRAAHKSWSKRRINRANNALVIGNFTEDAVNHIVEMINYNTMAPAIENLNKVLNFKLSEIAEDGEESKRNVRIAFQEAYGKEALNYLETFLNDLNGGAVQDQRKTLRDRMLSVFKKNAVAGSLSVTAQQPLSYIRAALMLNPMDLARALSPTYWKGSWAEMQKYSGVAVIKDMGRFDMNFGQSAKDFIAPETRSSAYKKISDLLTAAPEMADRMTWTRMWSACKIEQHRLHPEMDITSDEFLTRVAERFNDVMRKTQVYDSVLVKSSNMRSQKFEMKLLTSFMAEPTLSLNVLADAVQNFKEKGGKTMAAKAAATFLVSAALQAAVKGLMGMGRTPDDKKTREENFLYKYLQAFLSEVNPISLIPGYGDLVELLKNGELSDDAMGVLGKITTVGKTAMDMLNGKGRGAYRDFEDTAGQVAQLFSNIPLKNIMRDLRATVTWFSGSAYANRPTSGAVIRHQFEAQLANADNLIGVINSLMGDAGFQTKTSAYYQRLFDAMQEGNQAEADSIREYLTLGKGVKEESISSGLKGIAKQSMEAADADEWMIDQGMMDGTSTITKQLKAGEISFDEAERLMKKADPKLTDNDVWWKLDRIRYQQEKKLDEAPGGNYYRLTDAINANKAEEIRKAVKDVMAHGVTKEQIIKKIGDWKTPYKTADTAAERRVIRDALQKTYKAMGLTAEDADKKIDSWYPESNKNKKTTKKNSKKKDTSGSISKGTLSASAGGSSGGNSELFWRNMYANTTGKLMGKGNIDLNSRKVVHNEDGSISTEISMSFYDEETGKEVLIPTVIDGKIVDDDTAIDHYYETGEYLGRFDTPEEAEEYAERLHERQDWYYNR